MRRSAASKPQSESAVWTVDRALWTRMWMVDGELADRASIGINALSLPLSLVLAKFASSQQESSVKPIVQRKFERSHRRIAANVSIDHIRIYIYTNIQIGTGSIQYMCV